MTGKKIEGASDNLDRLGRAIIRASADNEEAVEAAAAQPFLYTRLRARINSERVRCEEGERWRALFGVIWRAVPAMALVAFLAFVLFLSASFTRTIAGYSDEALLDERDAGVERVVFTTERQPLSSDDVLATILNDEERGASR
ncbi:MAG: hypothetical protein ICV60_11090 [Pyrinomonadaceae bacterium]|nr:hypothetical protein [Pyrinomonadaceae bacterium]